MKTIAWKYEYDVEELSGEYAVREWTWGERIEITEAATKIKSLKKVADGDSSGLNISPKELELRKVLVCLTKAPFEINRKTILGLPDIVVQDILEEINKVNVVKKKRKKTYIE